VFNGLASKDAGGLVDLSPGDFISSSSGPVGDCDRRIDSGTFVVQNVNHVISPRVGWEVTAHVAAVPTAGITTTSYIYNPESEETWEDIAAYEKSDARAATPFVDFIK
jgi:hypothetical protein